MMLVVAFRNAILASHLLCVILQDLNLAHLMVAGQTAYISTERVGESSNQLCDVTFSVPEYFGLGLMFLMLNAAELVQHMLCR
jgi:hypothetical protein